MYRVSPETAASAATFSARSKQARTEPSQFDGFSALVDSNVPADTDRAATSAPDAPPQRLDNGDTTPKADNRPDTKANNPPDDGTQTRLISSKSGKANSNKPDANKAENAKSDTAKSGDDTIASSDAADTTANVDFIAAAANAAPVVVSGDVSAKTADTKPSSDKKTKDTVASDVAAPTVSAVVVDASAVVAAAVSTTVAIDVQTQTPAVKLDPQTGIIQSVAATSPAAVALSVATSETKASAKSATAAAKPVTAQAVPATDEQQGTPAAVDTQNHPQPADLPTKATTDTPSASIAAFATPAPALDASAVTDVADDANLQAATPVSGKPKTDNSTASADKPVLTSADASTTDKPLATPSLPGQSAQADAVRGAEHPKGEGDKQALTADTSDAAPADTKQATASAVPPPSHGDHHAPAVTRAAPADLNLQPIQTQQIQPPQTQAQNLTVTPAVQTNSTLANTPVPVSGLAVDIALRAAGGSSRFEIRLDPAELGRIDVRLDVDKHGNVTSHLTVERPATLDMLRQDAPKLQQALQDAGLKTGDSGLQFSLRDQSSGRNDDNGSGRNSQRLIISDDDAVPAQVAGRTYGRGLASSSGVDISV